MTSLMNLLELGDEYLLRIFSHLDALMLIRSAVVCGRFHRVQLSNDKLWRHKMRKWSITRAANAAAGEHLRYDSVEMSRFHFESAFTTNVAMWFFRHVDMQSLDHRTFVIQYCKLIEMLRMAFLRRGHRGQILAYVFRIPVYYKQSTLVSYHLKELGLRSISKVILLYLPPGIALLYRDTSYASRKELPQFVTKIFYCLYYCIYPNYLEQFNVVGALNANWTKRELADEFRESFFTWVWDNYQIDMDHIERHASTQLKRQLPDNSDDTNEVRRSKRIMQAM